MIDKKECLACELALEFAKGTQTTEQLICISFATGHLSGSSKVASHEGFCDEHAPLVAMAVAAWGALLQMGHAKKSDQTGSKAQP